MHRHPKATDAYYHPRCRSHRQMNHLYIRSNIWREDRLTSAPGGSTVLGAGRAVAPYTWP